MDALAVIVGLVILVLFVLWAAMGTFWFLSSIVIAVGALGALGVLANSMPEENEAIGVFILSVISLILIWIFIGTSWLLGSIGAIVALAVLVSFQNRKAKSLLAELSTKFEPELGQQHAMDVFKPLLDMSQEQYFVLCVSKKLYTQKLAEAERRYNQKLEEAEIYSQVRIHLNALRHNLQKSIEKDDYGTVTRDGRYEACIAFLDSCNLMKYLPANKSFPIVLAAVDELSNESQKNGFDPDNYPHDGHEYEYYVADGLKNYGWDAEVTKGSGDQGIDILAKKNGLVLGIQTKRFAGNVGNKAVQEAIAGCGFHNADKACVITNADFTKSAKDLALSSDVILLNHYRLADLEKLVFEGE